MSTAERLRGAEARVADGMQKGETELGEFGVLVDGKW